MCCPYIHVHLVDLEKGPQNDGIEISARPSRSLVVSMLRSQVAAKITNIPTFEKPVKGGAIETMPI